MFLTPSLAFSPPPSTSLLPSLNAVEGSLQFQGHFHTANSSHPHHHHAAHHHARRANHTPNPRSTLALLAADERAIEHRKLAIANYGYSWLKPAGCTKTMLGRREEEVEREEVERQLREVEMQERAALEAEEQERLAQLQDDRNITGERDLDDDVPEADDDLDDDEDEDDQSAEEEEGAEDGMGADLDDEIPDADEGLDSSDAIGEISGVSDRWVYDTNREQDSDEGEAAAAAAAPHQMGFGGLANVPRLTHQRGMRGPSSDPDVDERAAEELANEMLEDEDDMAEMDFDDDHDHDNDDAGGYRDLDADIPDAADDGGWEHTDSELEDSEMDISILPGQPTITMPESPGPRRRSSTRVISGNAAAASTTSQRRFVSFQTQTPQFSAIHPDSSALASGSGASNNTRRNWLDTARARRNLFGISHHHHHSTAHATPQNSGGGASSGRLFTPSPALAQETPEPGPSSTAADDDGHAPQRRTGRFLGRRRRENQDNSLD